MDGRRPRKAGQAGVQLGGARQWALLALGLSSTLAVTLFVLMETDAQASNKSDARPTGSPDSTPTPVVASLHDANDAAPAFERPTTPEVLATPPSNVTRDVVGVATGRIVDEQGAPVVGALVAMQPDTHSARLSGLGEVGMRVLEGDPRWIDELAPWEKLTTVTTDAGGRFTLEVAFPHPERAALPEPGAITAVTDVSIDGTKKATRSILPKLLVRHPGFIPARQDCTAWAAWTDGKYDAGVCTLRRGGSVIGRVVDSEGRPQSGAAVFLGDNVYPARWERPEAKRITARGCGSSFGDSDVVWDWRSTGHLAFATHTDEAGRFQITGIPERGSVWLMVDASGHPPARMESFRLVAQRTHDIGTLQLAAGSRLAGRVTDVAGRPVAGAEIMLGAHHLGGDFSVHERLAAAREGYVDHSGDASMAAILTARLHGARTDALGRWAIDGLDRSRYEVFVESRGLEPGYVPGVAVGQQDVDVELNETHQWQLRLQDPDGKPLDVVRLAMHTPIESELQSWKAHQVAERARTWLEVDSAFDVTASLWSIPGVCSCAQQLTLETRAKETYKLELEGWRPDDAAGARTVRVTAEQLQVPEELAFSSTGALVVKLTDASGESVNGATIKLSRYTTGSEPTHVTTARTKDTGIGMVRIRRHGQHRIDVRMSSSGPIIAQADVLISTDGIIGSELVATGIRHVAGQIVGDSAVLHSCKVRVQVCKPDSEAHDRAGHGGADHDTVKADMDSSGRFSFWVNEGTAGTLRAWTKTGCTDELSFDLRSAQRVDNLLLTLGNETVSGIVRSEDSGEPVSGARVSLKTDGPRASITVKTDDEGVFRFEGVAPGHFTLSAWRSGWAIQSLGRFEVKVGVSTALELHLPLAGAVEGRLLTADGDSYLPWSRLIMYRMASDGRWLYTSSVTLTAGRFRLSASGMGTYRILISAERYGSSEYAEVLPNSPAAWDIALGPGEALERNLSMPQADYPEPPPR